MAKIDLQKDYNDLFQFLGQFAADADFDIFDEEYTIKRVFRPHNETDIEWTKIIKSQASKVLSIKPFPYEEIQHASDTRTADYKKSISIRESQVKVWLIYIIDLLEKRVNGEL